MCCSMLTLTPASAPVSRSAFRNGLLRVRTFARRKLRYNSFSVGARKARYIDPVTETLRPKERRTERRGLKARSLRDGYNTLGDVHVPKTGVQIELALKLFQSSNRPARMIVQLFQRMRSSPNHPRMRCRPPAALFRVCVPDKNSCSSLAPITSIRSIPAISVWCLPRKCVHCAAPPTTCSGTYWISVSDSLFRLAATDENR